MESYVIGLDIGTTSAKSIIFTKTGHVLSEHETGYPISHPETGYAEQDPLQIEIAAFEAIKKSKEKIDLAGEAIQTVGISTAMHSLICMNRHGEPLSPSIIWADARSAEEADQLKQEHADIYMRTGTPLHPMSPLSKLIWMKNHSYPPREQADYFVSIKEFLLFRWFGVQVVDYSVAASTGLFNIHQQDWDQESLAIAGIEREQLFKPVPPTYKIEGMAPHVCTHSGLARNTPFIIGASDGPLANLGIGAIHPGETAVTIGTSGAVRQFSNQPLLDEQQEVFSYSFTEDLWITGGPSNNGGLVLNWVQQLWETEAEQVSLEQLSEMAKDVSAGSDHLLFLPYLNGERAPFWNAEAKGAFIGLTPVHTKEHMTRAAMEGVLYSILHIAYALERLGNKHEKVLASGGFARSPVWVQMLADMLNQPIHIPKSHQSSAWGAAWLGLYSIGEVDQLEDIKDSIPMDEHYVPNEENHKKYKELFSIYQSVSHHLQDDFRKLHRLS